MWVGEYWSPKTKVDAVWILSLLKMLLSALESVIVRVLSVGPSSLGIHGSTPKLQELLCLFGYCVAGTTDGSGLHVL